MTTYVLFYSTIKVDWTLAYILTIVNWLTDWCRYHSMCAGYTVYMCSVLGMFIVSKCMKPHESLVQLALAIASSLGESWKLYWAPTIQSPEADGSVFWKARNFSSRSRKARFVFRNGASWMPIRMTWIPPPREMGRSWALAFTMHLSGAMKSKVGYSRKLICPMKNSGTGRRFSFWNGPLF